MKEWWNHGCLRKTWWQQCPENKSAAYKWIPRFKRQQDDAEDESHSHKPRQFERGKKYCCPCSNWKGLLINSRNNSQNHRDLNLLKSHKSDWKVKLQQLWMPKLLCGRAAIDKGRTPKGNLKQAAASRSWRSSWKVITAGGMQLVRSWQWRKIKARVVGVA